MFVMSTIPDPPAAATRRSSWTHTSGSSTIRLSSRLWGFHRRKPSVSIETGAVEGGAFRSWEGSSQTRESTNTCSCMLVGPRSAASMGPSAV
jgi:hypothetical protein